MKKILFLGSLNSGGAEHQMVLVASMLKNDGFDVTFLCADDSVFYQKLLFDADVPIIRIKNSKICSLLKMNIPYLTICLFSVLRKGQYDTVISFLDLFNFLNCYFVKFNFSRHRVITGLRHHPISIVSSKRLRFYERYEQYSSAIISNSNNSKLQYERFFPESKKKLCTIYNFVVLPQVDSLYVPMVNGKVHIIIPATYRDIKNPFGLLKALILLSEQEKKKLHISWYGAIARNAEVFRKMSDFISFYNLGETIELNDVTFDIASKINEADVVGLFSKYEGLPNAICEGMMLGKPIIMTRVSDYDTLVDETNGVLCDWDKPESIKNALVVFSQFSIDELSTLGRNSKIKAEKLFSQAVLLNEWKNIV